MAKLALLGCMACFIQESNMTSAPEVLRVDW